MNWTKRAVATVAMAVAVSGQMPGSLDAQSREPGAPVTYYCPMHPDVTAAAPGACSRCAMALVPGDPLDLREYRVDLAAEPRAVRRICNFRFACLAEAACSQSAAKVGDLQFAILFGDWPIGAIGSPVAQGFSPACSGGAGL